MSHSAGSGTIFIILARGGSKRLPGKSLLTIGGVPLIGRTVRTARMAARRLGSASRVVVSTDDEVIARTARSWGAETPFLRPAALATDTATSADAVHHTIDWYANHGEHFKEIVLLQLTSPLCEAGDVLGAIELFRRSPESSLVSVRVAAHGRAGIAFHMEEGVLQGADRGGGGGTAVELNGAIYICSPEWLARTGKFCVAGETRAWVMPGERSIDVDTATDFQMAEAIWQHSRLWTEGRCLVIAEAGVNHDGSLDTARRLIDVAAECGADAVKFQTFSADRVVTRDARKAAYQKVTTSSAESQYEMLKRLELSADDHRELLNHCREADILFLSSAFGEEDVDLLDELNVAALKFGSGELTNLPLLRHAGMTLRPIILSTGCSTLREVAEAVETLRSAGCAELALLQCVSNYPANPADANLRAMQTLASAFHVPVGFSDHTEGIEISAAAVALGAQIVEKHFTLDRSRPGPDHRASLEPEELSKLIRAIRNVESALGNGVKAPTVSEHDTREVARKSLVAKEDLPAGTMLERRHLVCKRPGTGIPPRFMEQVLGLELLRELNADELLSWSHVRRGGS